MFSLLLVWNSMVSCLVHSMVHSLCLIQMGFGYGLIRRVSVFSYYCCLCKCVWEGLKLTFSCNKAALESGDWEAGSKRPPMEGHIAHRGVVARPALF